MEFPHHHQHHNHQPRDNEEEEDHHSFRQQPPPQHNNFIDGPPPPSLYQPQQPHFDPYAPPPPYLEAPSPPPPFGHVSHVGHVTHHTSNELYPSPDDHQRYPPTLGSHNAGYPPNLESQGGGYTGVMHVAHNDHSDHQSNMFSDDESRVPDNLAGLAGRSTVKVYSKAEPDYYLTIRDGKVILAPADPSDQAQHWYKDEKYSTRVKDEEGFPCFALVNKATGEAVKHSVGATQPVHLVRYDPDKLDESVLWTQSKDMGEGYRTIRMVNNVRLNCDAYHGDKKSGGVRDGTSIVLWNWNKGDNQLWKIFPF